MKDRAIEAVEAWFKMTLQHTALMSTESRFSEMILSRNFLIALQPIGLSKFCKKYGIAHTLGNRKTYLTKGFAFYGFWESSFQNILLASESNFSPNTEHAHGHTYQILSQKLGQFFHNKILKFGSLHVFYKKLGSGHSTKSFFISHEILSILVLKVS